MQKTDCQDRALTGRFRNKNVEPTFGFGFGSRGLGFLPNIRNRCCKCTGIRIGIEQRKITRVFAFLGNTGYKF